jgi:7-cyano-7-deazaguanine synthase
VQQSYNDHDAVILISGGQDSTTCLFWAMTNFRTVHAISFLYGQKHAAEVEAADRICSRAGVEHRSVDLSFLPELAVSRLFTGTGTIEGTRHPLNESVPSSFVPYRNLLFLTVASVWASTLRVRHIVAGMCETDSSGYADCRDAFVKSAQATLDLSVDFKDLGIVIHTPLMWLTKAETFRLAETLGCLDIILDDTITCYNGSTAKNNFGLGCGSCPACVLRAKGYREYVEKYGTTGAS